MIMAPLLSIDKKLSGHFIPINIMRYCLFSIIFFTILYSTTLSEHVTVTYHFWKKSEKIVEKAEWFTKFISNSNRFWTSNLVFSQKNEKADKIQISSESWKSANVEETVTHPLDEFFTRIFQKFAGQLYSNLALDSIPIFNSIVFQNSYREFENYEFDKVDDGLDVKYWLKIGDVNGNDRNKLRFLLLTRKETFEHWEAIVHFIDAIQKSNEVGYVVDCDRESEYCKNEDSSDHPILIALKPSNDDEKTQIKYEGDFQKDHVCDWILTIRQPVIRILNEDVVPQYRSGIVPGFDRPRDSVTMLFIHTKKSQIWRNYLKFAKENHGKYHLTAMISEEVMKWSIYPAFITMKPKDDYVKAFTLHKDIHWNRMVEFIEDGLHPSSHPLTCASEFLYATSTKKPLIVFFDPLNSNNAEDFKKAASNQQTSERTCHFAAITGLDLFGLYIMNMLNVHSPSYIVIKKAENGWCINSRAIENDGLAPVLSWVRNLEPTSCQDLIEDYKFPIARLHLLERYDDMAELEEDHTAVVRNKDEL